MNSKRVSTFALERYKLDELDQDDRQTIAGAMALDSSIRSRLEELDGSDRDLRLRYPFEYFNFENPDKEESGSDGSNPAPLKHRKMRLEKPAAGNRMARFACIAAVAAVCIILPVIYFMQNNRENSPQDRVKGLSRAETELSIYLKGSSELPISGEAVLQEGNTVQLAYSAPSGEHYGVIFSIDGRSTVTMHYPYREGQSSLLVSGKHTFLSEAYTLDDAPDFEVFIMVISENPLDPEKVLEEAERIAANSSNSPRIMEIIEGKHGISGQWAAFPGCEVKTITILKK